MHCSGLNRLRARIQGAYSSHGYLRYTLLNWCPSMLICGVWFLSLLMKLCDLIIIYIYILWCSSQWWNSGKRACAGRNHSYLLWWRAGRQKSVKHPSVPSYIIYYVCHILSPIALLPASLFSAVQHPAGLVCARALSAQGSGDLHPPHCQWVSQG